MPRTHCRTSSPRSRACDRSVPVGARAPTGRPAPTGTVWDAGSGDGTLPFVPGARHERLAMTFASREAYRDFWRSHPALRGDWSPLVEAYVDYNLGGREPELRSRADVEAVRADFSDLLTGADYATAFAALRHETVFLRAERGMLDEPVGLYPQRRVGRGPAPLAADHGTAGAWRQPLHDPLLPHRGARSRGRGAGLPGGLTDSGSQVGDQARMAGLRPRSQTGRRATASETRRGGRKDHAW
jgi:hypothetical protein